MIQRIAQVCLLFAFSASVFADELEELEAELGMMEPSLWMGDVRLSTGYGYGENLLLSEIAPKDSRFTFLEGEVFAMRPMPDLEAELLVSAFFDSKIMDELEELNHESIGLFNAEFTKLAGENSLWGIGLEHVYVKQAFDTSFDEVEVYSQVIQTREPAAYLRWETGALGFEWNARIKYSDTFFDDDANNFDTLDYSLWASRSLSEMWHSRIGIRYYDREYDERFARGLNGLKIQDDLLVLSSAKIDLRLIRDFEFGNYDGQMKIGLNRWDRWDHSEGYSDRDGWEGKFGIELAKDDWEFELGLNLDRREYRNQIEADGNSRTEESISWSARIERIFNEKWAVFVYAGGENEDTNMEFASFDTMSVTLGVRLPGFAF